MSASSRMDHNSEFGQQQNALAFGRVDHVDGSSAPDLALLVSRYGHFDTEGITDADRTRLLASLLHKTRAAKEAAIDTEDVAAYRDFASVEKMVQCFITHGEEDTRDAELWMRFEPLARAGAEREKERTFGPKA